MFTKMIGFALSAFFPLAGLAYTCQASEVRYADFVADSPGGGYSDQFGFAADVDGEWAAVSFPQDGVQVGSGGSVRLYRRSSGGFDFFEDIYPDPIPSLAFGIRHLDLRGDLLVVDAALYIPPSGGHIGAVYVFRFDGMHWVMEGFLEAADPAWPSTGFGQSFTIVDNDTILIGSHADTRSPVSAVNLQDGSWSPTVQYGTFGSIYVFERTSVGWAQTQRFGLHYPPEAAGFNDEATLSGYSLAADGDTVVVGNLQYGIWQLSGIGGLYHANLVKRHSTGVWYDAGPIRRFGGHENELFGYSVAIEGDLMAIGAPVYADILHYLHPGRVHLYREISGTWVHETTLFASDASVLVTPGGEVSDRFGESVSIHDGRVLVGGKWQRPDGGPKILGSGYLFEDRNGVWQEVYRCWTPDDDGNAFHTQEMGRVVALDEDVALVTDPLGLAGSVWGSGSAHFFYLPFGATTCDGVVNSTGSPAHLEMSGSRKVQFGHLRARVDSLPQGQAGMLLAGTSSALLPGAGGSMGTLCLGGNLARFGSQIAYPDSEGKVQIAIDMSAIPTNPSSAIGSGDTWYFQYWYRDQVGGQGTSNFSGAVSVGFH
ncbi:MAG: hypothetical protein R3F33_03895 [Planctomycetota bacterium]